MPEETPRSKRILQETGPPHELARCEPPATLDGLTQLCTRLIPCHHLLPPGPTSSSLSTRQFSISSHGLLRREGTHSVRRETGATLKASARTAHPTSIIARSVPSGQDMVMPYAMGSLDPPLVQPPWGSFLLSRTTAVSKPASTIGG